MRIKTFKNIAKRLPVDISVLIRGRHGSGKSQCVYQIAKELNLPVLERRLSQLTEGDLIGLPHKLEQNGKPRATKFLPMDWFVDAMEKPYLIFLDELDRSQSEVLQSVFELLLDRSIQGNKIHPECRIFSAINGGQFGAHYNIQQLDLALLDRVWICDLSPTVEEWLEWGKETNEILPSILRFIEKSSEFLEEEKLDNADPTLVSPSRRSWHRLSHSLKQEYNKDVMSFMDEIDTSSARSDERYNLLQGICSGFVGINSTSMFMTYLSDINKFFKAENILNEFSVHVKKLKTLGVEEHNNIITKLEVYFNSPHDPITQEQLANLSRYIDILPKELVTSLIGKLTAAVDASDYKEREKIAAMAADRLTMILRDS